MLKRSLTLQHFLFITLSMEGLAACGGGGGDGGPLPPSAPPAPRALEGNWATGCKPSTLKVKTLSAGNLKASHKSLHVAGDEMNYTSAYFLDDGCTQPLGEMVQHGHYREGQNLPDGQNARALDILIEKTEFIVHNASAAKAFNELKFCGLEGWGVNQPMDVTGKTCALGSKVPAADTTHYTAYRIEAGALYLGDYDCSEGDEGCRSVTTPAEAPAGREAALKIVYQKQ